MALTTETTSKISGQLAGRGLGRRFFSFVSARRCFLHGSARLYYRHQPPIVSNQSLPYFFFVVVVFFFFFFFFVFLWPPTKTRTESKRPVRCCLIALAITADATVGRGRARYRRRPNKPIAEPQVTQKKIMAKQPGAKSWETETPKEKQQQRWAAWVSWAEQRPQHGNLFDYHVR